MKQHDDQRRLGLTKHTNHLDQANGRNDREEHHVADRMSSNGTVPWVVEFRIVGTSSIARAPFKETMLIGRLDSQNDIYPDIDMGLYKGQHLGVSRRHAKLTARDNRVTIQDLDSANGTSINDERLVPYKDYRLHEGDTITLGKIALKVHFVLKPYANDETRAGIGNMLPLTRVGHNEHLLIVDDNPDVCQVIQFVVKRSGFQASIAHNVSQAIARVDELNVDGLIIETLLEQASGLDVIQYLRMKKPDAPILAISATSGGYSIGQAMGQGADLYLNKPIAVDELAHRLSEMAQLLKPSSDR